MTLTPAMAWTLIGGGLAAGVGSTLMPQKGPSTPDIPAMPKMETTGDMMTNQKTQAAMLQERMRAKQKKGFEASILTGPSGLSTIASTTKPTILGA